MDKYEEPLFQELYSWYLRSPGISGAYKKADRRGIYEKAGRQNQRQCCQGSLRGGIAEQRHQTGALCGLCLCPFLRYGLEITERAEYEFRAMDMGNVIHQALEKFLSRAPAKGTEVERA